MISFLAIQYGQTWCFIAKRAASEWTANRHKPHHAIMRDADGTMRYTPIRDVTAVPGKRFPMDRVPADIAAQLQEFAV